MWDINIFKKMFDVSRYENTKKLRLQTAVYCKLYTQCTYIFKSQISSLTTTRLSSFSLVLVVNLSTIELQIVSTDNSVFSLSANNNMSYQTFAIRLLFLYYIIALKLMHQYIYCLFLTHLIKHEMLLTKTQ